MGVLYQDQTDARMKKKIHFWLFSAKPEVMSLMLYEAVGGMSPEVSHILYNLYFWSYAITKVQIDKMNWSAWADQMSRMPEMSNFQETIQYYHSMIPCLKEP